MSENYNDANVIAPVKTGSLRVKVYETLREAIFSGRLQPGESIREAHMARALQVSQPTVREALIQLEHAGLVVRNPHQDTTVTRLDDSDIRERCWLRVLLESEAAAHAVPHIAEEETRILHEKLAKIHTSLAADDYHAFVAADLDFHRYVWRLSGLTTLYKILDIITVPMLAFFSIHHSRTLKNLASVVRSHDPLVEALKSGDPERAREAFREHIESSYSSKPASSEP